MALPVVPRLTSTTPDLTRNGDLAKKAVDPLLAQKFLNGRLITDISVTAGTRFVVNHGLGRAPSGVVVVSVTGASAQCVVRNSSTAAANPNTQLALVPSATATLALWVF